MLSSTLSIKKVIALTCCLCHLHNFCIDNGSAKVPAWYEHDVLTLMDFADVPIGDSAEDVSPVGLLGGGEHFDDIDGGRRGVTLKLTIRMNKVTHLCVCPKPSCYNM